MLKEVTVTFTVDTEDYDDVDTDADVIGLVAEMFRDGADFPDEEGVEIEVNGQHAYLVDVET